MFEVGSMPPSGYIAWHEWADAQIKGGLKQSQCGECGLWYFPQEVNSHAPNKCSRRVPRRGAKVVKSKSKVSVGRTRSASNARRCGEK